MFLYKSCYEYIYSKKNDPNNDPIIRAINDEISDEEFHEEIQLISGDSSVIDMPTNISQCKRTKALLTYLTVKFFYYSSVPMGLLLAYLTADGNASASKVGALEFGKSELFAKESYAVSYALNFILMYHNVNEIWEAAPDLVVEASQPGARSKYIGALLSCIFASLSMGNIAYEANGKVSTFSYTVIANALLLSAFAVTMTNEFLASKEKQFALEYVKTVYYELSTLSCEDQFTKFAEMGILDELKNAGLIRHVDSYKELVEEYDKLDWVEQFDFVCIVGNKFGIDSLQQSTIGNVIMKVVNAITYLASAIATLPNIGELYRGDTMINKLIYNLFGDADQDLTFKILNSIVASVFTVVAIGAVLLEFLNATTAISKELPYTKYWVRYINRLGHELADNTAYYLNLDKQTKSFKALRVGAGIGASMLVSSSVILGAYVTVYWGGMGYGYITKNYGDRLIEEFPKVFDLLGDDITGALPWVLYSIAMPTASAVNFKSFICWLWGANTKLINGISKLKNRCEWFPRTINTRSLDSAMGAYRSAVLSTYTLGDKKQNHVDLEERFREFRAKALNLIEDVTDNETTPLLDKLNNSVSSPV